jgi:hypothetical protein
MGANTVGVLLCWIVFPQWGPGMIGFVKPCCGASTEMDIFQNGRQQDKMVSGGFYQYETRIQLLGRRKLHPIRKSFPQLQAILKRRGGEKPPRRSTAD